MMTDSKLCGPLTAGSFSVPRAHRLWLLSSAARLRFRCSAPAALWLRCSGHPDDEIPPSHWWDLKVWGRRQVCPSLSRLQCCLDDLPNPIQF